MEKQIKEIKKQIKDWSFSDLRELQDIVEDLVNEKE